MTGFVVCTKCRWTHFAVTRKYAEDEVARFNAYYDTLTPEQQEQNYGNKKASIDGYERCWCGNTEFVPGNTAPNGSTIGPVIYEGET